MSEERDMINKVPGSSPEFRTELAEQLAELAPEAIADGKIDVEKLKELLEGDASDTSERFGLFWPGKKRAMRAAQTPTTATLRPDKENSKDWDTTKNVFIEGDNLEVLKILQKHYHGKIKMIYIDPPYNTGKDFVYPDNYKEGLETYLEWSKQVNEDGKKLSSNSESEGRYHSNWLNMMYPRLKLARNLLTDDGVIFISIDDCEYANLKRTTDEIYGEDSFIGSFIRRTINSGKQDSTTVSVYHEYLLVYARRMTSVALNRKMKSEEERANLYPLEDSYVDTRGRHYLSQLDKGSLQYSDSMNFPIIAPDGSEVWPGEGFDDKTRIFRWSKEKIAWGIENDYVVFKQKKNGSWKIYAKSYEFRDNSDKPIIPSNPRTTLDFVSKDYSNFNATPALQRLFDGKNYFDFPKPVPFIRALIDYATDKDSLILDFFAGSSTTGHATLEQNATDNGDRKFIMVQLPEPLKENSVAHTAGFGTIADLSRERVRRAGESIRASFSEDIAERNSDFDIGFRTYTLADTNFTKWRSDSDTDATALEQHLLDLRESADDNATPDDLLTEILLKQGHSLVEQIRNRNVDGLSYKAVVRVDDEDSEEDTLVLAYLDEHTKPTLAQLRAALEVKPAQFIMLEDAFQGDDQLKTNLAQICKTNGIELWTA